MGEVTSIRLKQIAISNPSLALITFAGTESKGAQRKGEPETIPIRCKSVIACLATLKASSEPDDFVVG